jgi:hypothetical protein
MTVYEPDPKQLKELLSMTTAQFCASRLVIKIYSELLDAEIYLVSDADLAREVEGAAYTAKEIDALGKIRDSLKPHYRERLQKIHEAKKIFGGTVFFNES